MNFNFFDVGSIIFNVLHNNSYIKFDYLLATSEIGHFQGMPQGLKYTVLLQRGTLLLHGRIWHGLRESFSFLVHLSFQRSNFNVDQKA